MIGDGDEEANRLLAVRADDLSQHMQAALELFWLQVAERQADVVCRTTICEEGVSRKEANMILQCRLGDLVSIQ